MIADRRIAEFLMAVYLVVVAFIVWWPSAAVATESVNGIGSAELVQLLFLPGRSAAMIDVVANTLGALTGYLLVRALPNG